MSSSSDPQYQIHTQENPNGSHWETAALAWLSNLPEGPALTLTDVELWLECNRPSLPEEIKSIPPAQLLEHFISLKISPTPPVEEKDGNQFDHRFQRTDQWMPIYSWLESLNTDEVIKSKDILDWLNGNPEVRDQLYSRHSRYHLMHYIKKCHVKILKRKEKKKGLVIDDTSSPKVQSCSVSNEPAVSVNLSGCNFGSLPKEGDIFKLKQNEALHKYQILVELEKQLLTVFSKREQQSA